MEDFQKSMITVINHISEYYVDEKVADKIVKSLKTLMESSRWKELLQLENLDKLRFIVNCTMFTESLDNHLYLSTFYDNYSNTTGIETYTPNYIKINHFNSFTNENVRNAYMDAFSKFKSPLIIDVRDCPGGDPQLSYFILCSLFPDEKPLYKMNNRKSEEEIFHSVSEIPFYFPHVKIKKFSGDVKIMINSRTASAAELIAFVVKFHKRGKLYGTKTSGDCYLKKTIPIGVNLLLNISITKQFDLNGENWEGKGITPDFDVISKEFIKLIYDDLNQNVIPVKN